MVRAGASKTPYAGSIPAWATHLTFKKMKTITEETYNEFVKALRNKGVNCRANFMDDYEVAVECGRDYPDELFDKIYEEAEKLEIQENLCVCAEYSGGTRITSDRINSGPQRYSRW